MLHRGFWKALGALLLFPAHLIAQEGDFLSLQRRVVEVYEQNRQAVVRVKALFEEEGEDGQPSVTVKVGTGIFVSREGHLIANASRTHNADRVSIDLNGLPYACEVLGEDLTTNIALLRVVRLPDEFQFVLLPDDETTPAIGSMVISVSRPLEFEASPSFGLVTGRESSFFHRVFPTTYIRTSIPAGPGEGGAPLFDLNGNFVGIVMAGLADVQGSYSLPARAVRRVRDDLIFAGEVTYGWVGFEATQRTTLEEGTVVEVTGVTEGGPSADAGLFAGDRLIRMGSEEIATIADVRDAIFYTRADQFIDVVVMRGEEELTKPLRVVARPEGESYYREVRTDGSEETGPIGAEAVASDVLQTIGAEANGEGS